MTEKQNEPLNDENFLTNVLKFRERQAGVAVVFDPTTERYSYNAYCVETALLKELFTCEFDFLDDALNLINAEFGSWELSSLEKQSGCSTCIAK
jgi:hypothetical protein